MPVELKLLQEDKRGYVQLFVYEGREHLLIFTKAGQYRGGEIHIGQQTNFLISGVQEWTIGEKWEKTFSPKMITIPAHTPHMMYSQSDSLMIECREYVIENPVIYYEPFRKIIEEQNNE